MTIAFSLSGCLRWAQPEKRTSRQQAAGSRQQAAREIVVIVLLLGKVWSSAFRRVRISPPEGGTSNVFSLKRIEEGNQAILVGIAQIAIVVDDGGRFTGVAQDRLIAGQRLAVVHEGAT